MILPATRIPTEKDSEVTQNQLSIIVPAVNTPADLIECLEAIAKQKKDVALEVLVVDRVGSGQSVARIFPWVRLLPVPPNTTIPQMRAIAFREAKGEAIAVIEDHVIVPEDWAKRMLEAIREGKAIVGGAVENAATETLMDWAAFLCEYSHCIPPIPAGSVRWLAGNNVIYTKKLIDEHREVIETGKWENYLHDTLCSEGVELFCRPDIVVGHKKHYTFSEYMSQRYLYARSYAGVRVEGSPFLRRAAYGIGALGLPPLLFYRTVSRIFSKRKHLDTLVKSLPLIALFVVSWALGEVTGYFFGPGDSLSRVC